VTGLPSIKAPAAGAFVLTESASVRRRRMTLRTSRRLAQRSGRPQHNCRPFYESDCQGRTSVSLMARGFSPDQSTPAAELVKRAGASGIAGQSASSASVSSLQLLIRLDVGGQGAGQFLGCYARQKPGCSQLHCEDRRHRAYVFHGRALSIPDVTAGDRQHAWRRPRVPTGVGASPRMLRSLPQRRTAPTTPSRRSYHSITQFRPETRTTL
jgi:hypothetical protein